MPSKLSKQLKTALNKSKDNPNALPYKCTRLYRDVKSHKASLVAVASYVRDKARYKGACTESKERIANMLDLSRATVYRHLNALDDIKRDGHKLIPIKFEGKKYDKYPEFLNGYIFTFTIKRKGKNVTLTRALKATEKKIYGIIYAWLNSPKNTAGFYLTSISMLANISGYATSTVVEALHVLLRCGLIYRTSDNKGTSRAHMSAYRLGTKTLRKISKELDVQTRQGERKEQPQPGEIEIYYSELRAQAEIIADKNQEICKADSEFEELDRKSIDLSMKYAFAEVNAQQPGASDEAKDRARRLERELEEVNERRRERLHVLGFEEEDLRPRYNCDKCDDTGYDKRGRPCDCSPWRSKCKWKKPNILYLIHQ